MDWNSNMDEAPKDGTPIDVWCVPPEESDFEPELGGVRFTGVAWHDGDAIFPHTGWIRVLDDGDWDLINGPPTSDLGCPAWVPTHWMLPPPAPKEQEQE